MKQRESAKVRRSALGGGPRGKRRREIRRLDTSQGPEQTFHRFHLIRLNQRQQPLQG